MRTILLDSINASLDFPKEKWVDMFVAQHCLTAGQVSPAPKPKTTPNPNPNPTPTPTLTTNPNPNPNPNPTLHQVWWTTLTLTLPVP